MSALAIALEFCPDCGREWPSRFGSHNCNHHRVHIHNNAIIVQPGEPLAESVERLTSRLESEAMRSNEFADLAGEPSEYPRYLADIDHTIGQLKRFRAQLQALSGHAHRWDENDYCSICGADGRA
jgi:hypothetical protein